MFLVEEEPCGDGEEDVDTDCTATLHDELETRCLIRSATSAERGVRLRERRVSHGITQQQVGEALCVPSSRISEIERRIRNLPELEQRAIQWIHSITNPKQHSQTLDNV
ncbi:helix-turn-helix domain-containing protein [Bifidobacterium breve]|uniref:helix-turn-helix domain-containing protein n=1 Tax=Bifidobacterium breve TaxID=1685 RepID=UPI0035634B51